MWDIIENLSFYGFIVLFGWRVNADGTKAFAIQNVGSGKDLRPLDARIHDGNQIISFDHHEWRCETWHLVPTGESVYKIRNRYTQKTIQPAQSPSPEVHLHQQPLKSGSPEWEFLSQGNESYLIRLKGSDLYMTATGSSLNSAIVLKPLEGSDLQRWRLLEQYPTF